MHSIPLKMSCKFHNPLFFNNSIQKICKVIDKCSSSCEENHIKLAKNVLFLKNAH